LSKSTTISFSRAVLRTVMNVQSVYKVHLQWMPYSLVEICRRFPKTYCRKQRQNGPPKGRQFADTLHGVRYQKRPLKAVQVTLRINRYSGSHYSSLQQNSESHYSSVTTQPCSVHTEQ